MCRHSIRETKEYQDKTDILFQQIRKGIIDMNVLSEQSKLTANQIYRELREANIKLSYK